MELAKVFEIGSGPLEMFVRGSAIYWFLFLLFRLVLRRDVGSIGIADVLFIVLIADASSNAMSGGYNSITDGVFLIATLAFWNYALDWICFRSAFLRRVLQGEALVLVKDGVLQRRAMRRELITLDELQAKLREHEVTDLGQVKIARMEEDGEITVERVEA